MAHTLLKNKENQSLDNTMIKEELSANPDRYRGEFPYFRQPSEVGQFSHDKAHNFIHNSSSLKFLRLPKDLDNVYLDLKINYDTFIEKDNTCAYLNSLLKWTKLNTHKFVVAPRANQAPKEASR